MARRLILLLIPIAGLVAVTVAIASAGGGSGSGTAAQPAPSAPGAAVAVGPTSLGRTLVDGRGRTLYLFEQDKGTASTCYGACATLWPPLTTTAPARAGSGIAAAKLGTTQRRDGTTEVT